MKNQEETIYSESEVLKPQVVYQRPIGHVHEFIDDGVDEEGFKIEHCKDCPMGRRKLTQ